ncbi:unnamed protein product [Sphagnum balticum]
MSKAGNVRSDTDWESVTVLTKKGPAVKTLKTQAVKNQRAAITGGRLRTGQGHPESAGARQDGAFAGRETARQGHRPAAGTSGRQEMNTIPAFDTRAHRLFYMFLVTDVAGVCDKQPE